ncbi:MULTISPECIES: Wzz/FepE/Etk N-terminal domain-containing protein [unclassified Pedobacter]|uniref:Wzz/FepE/Etk N-terminal domain-containing protein n=1 Tax=unclassified Pedobacter TaxID=2628915 RepID=UPI001E4EB71E|nr:MULTISPECIES: Wzz/FepE/Etk N-terminal domain-containing protein [unclassified Pedobacter]
MATKKDTMTTESQQSKSIENDEISLKELIIKGQLWWRYLLSKWIIIITSILIGSAIGFFYATSETPKYTATTTFVLEDEKGGGGLGNLAGLASMAGVDLGGSGGGIFQGENILSLYKSRAMLEKTLLSTVQINGKDQLLIDRFIAFNSLREKWADKPQLLKLNFQADSMQDGFPSLKPNRLRDSILGAIVTNLNREYLFVAKPDKKLSTIQVDVRAKDEIFAKAFDDQLVRNVNEFYVNTKTKKTLQNVRILQHKTDSVRAVMNGAIYSAIAVADATPNLNPTRQIQRAAPAQRSQFSAETNKTILAEMVKNLELTKMSLLRETPLIQVIDQPVYPLKIVRLGKVKGTVIGGVLFGFLIGLALTTKYIFKRILE